MNHFYRSHIRLGDHTVGTDPDCDSEICAEPHQQFSVVSAIPHPDYDKNTNSHDIAIIKLDRPFLQNGKNQHNRSINYS